MRKFLITISVVCTMLSASAKEGMWPPFLFSSVQRDMFQAGLQMDMEDIYSEQKESLKDAVVIFGGGCTGEVISSNGLVLTNHHCGYGTVQGLSDVENNYLLYGFFAKNLDQEIPCPGLTVKFIVSYKNITDEVLAEAKTSINPEVKDSMIKLKSRIILNKYKSDSDYVYVISDFYQGNQYYLIKQKVYRDIRLVAFPPNGIGKFGGDTDNWMWPRHTGDFGVFRIYADSTNEPASYSKTNIPYKPRKYFTINPDGAQSGVFTMVYGFPGRTSEYISSYELDVIQNVIDPSRIKCRQIKLDVWNAAMAESEEVFVKYARKQASVANYWKKWKGEVQGLKGNDVLSIKSRKETELKIWTNRNGSTVSELDSLKNLMASSQDLLKSYYYYLEALNGLELIPVANVLHSIGSAAEENRDLDSLLDYIKDDLSGFFKDYSQEIDRTTSTRLYETYRVDVPRTWQIGFVRNNANIAATLRSTFDKTRIGSIESVFKLLEEYEETKNFDLICNDPMYKIAESVRIFYEDTLKTKMMSYSSRQKLWNKNLMNHYYRMSSSGSVLYPDANSTLRLAYGKVEGVEAEDGLWYESYTTIDGIARKANPDVAEFDAPKKLLDLQRNGKYGRYGYDGKLPVCFLASNHTTGGNSGSPVLNSRGELIGLNFDRIWQGTMSDLYFDESICRNIAVNIRYVLFILDVYGDAGWLLDEMDIQGYGFR